MNMVWRNTPGATWTTRRLISCVCIGEVLVIGHLLMTLNTTPFLMPFYRACLIPTQSSFISTIDRKTYNPKDVLRNLHLALLFAYVLITTVCNIVVACLVKRRARQVQLVQNTIQFRVSSYFWMSASNSFMMPVFSYLFFRAFFRAILFKSQMLEWLKILQYGCMFCPTLCYRKT